MVSSLCFCTFLHMGFRQGHMASASAASVFQEPRKQKTIRHKMRHKYWQKSGSTDRSGRSLGENLGGGTSSSATANCDSCDSLRGHLNHDSTLATNASIQTRLRVPGVAESMAESARCAVTQWLRSTTQGLQSLHTEFTKFTVSVCFCSVSIVSVQS